MDFITPIQEVLVSFGSSHWVLVAIVVLTTIDGFFPPVPSDAVIIAASVLSVTDAAPNHWWLIAAAALGAFAGDTIAYGIGARIPLERMPILRGGRGRSAVARARGTLARRGGVVILSARFVPIGRAAVNMTAGAVGYPRGRFTGVTAVAAVLWATATIFIGMGAGSMLRQRPLAAMGLGVLTGVVLGGVIDRVVARASRAA